MIERAGAESQRTTATSLRELAALFFRLGATAFGGPAAHIAMMQDEVVRRRKWLSDERFLDMLGATNLIPGPNSTEMAIHIGYERAGWRGLLVAGASFILPATLITAVFGWAYVRFGALPDVAWLLYGVKPVILAVVVQAIWGLAPKAARTTSLRILAALSIVAAWMGVHELAVLFGAGAVTILGHFFRRDSKNGTSTSSALVLSLAPIATTTAATSFSLNSLFWVFFKAGALLFGSGYVLLAFLRADIVERFGWLTEAQLVDAIAVGQVTPGPVFTTATFIGYVLAGPVGASVATSAIFLPAFVFVALSGPLVPRLRKSATAGAFLDGVNVASLALMAVVTAQLGRAAMVDVVTVVLGLASAVVLVRWKPNSTWLVLGGAALGWIAHAVGIVGIWGGP